MSFQSPFHTEPTTEQLLATLGLDKASLPFSDEAERGIISCLLQNPDDRIPEVRSLVPPAAFYHIATRTIYNALVAMYDQQIPLDIALITHRLREMKLLETCGGAAFVSELYMFTPVEAHYGFYLSILMDKHHLRKQVRVCAQSMLAAMAHDRTGTGIPVSTILEESERSMRAVRDGTSAGEFKSTAEWMDELIDDIDSHVERRNQLMLQNETVIAGVSTGLPLIDERTNGYCQGHYWLVQARRSDGKTSWARQQGLALAMAPNPTPTVFYLTEGSAKDFWKCCLAHLTRIDINRILTGELTGDELAALAAAMNRIKAAPFFLRHKPGITKRELLTDMRMMHRKHGLAGSTLTQMLFIVDYLQRIKGRDKFQEDHEHVKSVSAEVTDLNGQLKSTAIMLAQLADDGKTGGSKAVPDDADVVMTISCPPKIDPASGKPMQRNDRFGNVVVTERDEEQRVLVFGKNRQGKRGGQPVTLAFNGAIQRFS